MEHFLKDTFRKIYQNTEGAIALEFAMLAPIMLLIAIGTAEFGTFYIKSQANNRNLSSASNAVMNNPFDPTNQELLNQGNLWDQTDPLTFSCASSHETLEEAKLMNCAPGYWNTEPPVSMSDEQGYYYVLIQSSAASRSITGLFDGIVPPNSARQIIKVFRHSDAKNMCNGEPLDNRSCYWSHSTVSRFNLPVERAATLKPIEVEGHLSINTPFTGEPECTEAGWSCSKYEVDAISARTNPSFGVGKLIKAGGAGVPTYTLMNGPELLHREQVGPKYQPCIAISQISNGPVCNKIVD